MTIEFPSDKVIKENEMPAHFFYEDEVENDLDEYSHDEEDFDDTDDFEDKEDFDDDDFDDDDFDDDEDDFYDEEE